MPHLRATLKSTFTSLTAALFMLFAPLPVWSASASADGCTPPDPATTGVRWPTGSDAATFTYQCTGDYAGKWTNTYYVYDPTNNSRTALYAPDYQYDCTAKTWTMTEWDFSAADSQYHQYRVKTTDPGLPTGCPVSTTGAAAPVATTSPAISPDTTGTAGASSTPMAVTTPATSGGSSTAAANAVQIGNTVTVTATNGITATAISGNAGVTGNTIGGNATTGNATDIATVVNMLQSSSNIFGNRPVATFTSNINGDVTGDLLLDPSIVSKIQPAATDLHNSVTVNNSTAAAINNTVNVGATTGNAAVSGNNTAGNATSGNAKAVANIINMINSAVNAGQSFIGTININGNLNGDILLPPNFIDQLLAANVPTVNVTVPNSSNTANTSLTNTSTLNNTTNQGIHNAVTASAVTGNASVSDNTVGGNANTGNAGTNITAFNLTGSQVVGQNALLVFVNVLGKWVGLIVNAPAGANAAALGGGIASNTTVTNNATVNNTTNEAINNNVNVAARSGDAAVTGNTRGGNATTGNAQAAVNLSNIENSSLSLANWFGILFINVFGSWNGSFGINTSAGDPVFPPTSGPLGSPAGSPTAMPAVAFRFVPRHFAGNSNGTSSPTGSTSTGSFTAQTAAETSPAPAGQVLAAQTTKAATSTKPQLQDAPASRYRTMAIIGGLVVLYIIGDALVSRRFRRA